MVAIDIGEALAEKISPFDTFVQVIEGVAEVNIDNIPNVLNTGQGIIILVDTSNSFRVYERFKMIATVIESGFEESVI